MCSLAAKSVLGAVTKGRGLIQCAVLDRRQSSNLSLWVARPAEPRLETPSTNLSVSQFSHSVVSDSLQSHGLQHTRSPCPSPTPRVYSNSCALNRWYYPVISSSVVPFSSHLRSFPASGSFPMRQHFAWGGQKYWSFSFSISPSNEYSGLISFRVNQSVGSPCSPRVSQESSPTPQFKSINSSVLSFLYSPTLTSIHVYWKNHKLWLDGPLLAK